MLQIAEVWKLTLESLQEKCCKMSLQLLNFVQIQSRRICLKLKFKVFAILINFDELVVDEVRANLHSEANC